MADGKFNEATRVQMPALIHLIRIGYSYFGKISEDKAGSVFDPQTNILLEIFQQQFERLNPNNKDSFKQVLSDIQKELDDDDLGRQFYKRLSAESPIKLIDFDNPKNNTYHCTAEFTCKNGEDEFRPDITLFINGLPLVFIEVKRPNNLGGMLAESRRMNDVRFPNRKFRRFINITQLMIFSNNMEYDTRGGIVPVEGVFYCTAAKKKAAFNCFREENLKREVFASFNLNYPYSDVAPETEFRILQDFNNQVLRENPEYKKNCEPYSPTNRVLTSMCSPERLLFLLKYGIAYIKTEKQNEDGSIETRDEKHIMRYQQFFAAMAIRRNIEKGVKSGIVWHTQGSGKTALSFHLTHVLKDSLAKQNKVARFYFIVDRLDLLEQASQEFAARGLNVATANSRKELMEQFRQNQALLGDSGQDEITVVNIQRFENDNEKVEIPQYATNLQRIFIMDEAHRGYKPNGCFLANLFNADPNSIKIALTGTPLLGEERSSCAVFGDYLHTYYYDRSIKDGYTLKIIREEIETSYREKITEVYEKLESLVQKKDIAKSDIIEHDVYVKELLRYIINDLKNFRAIQGDDSLGGMVICETSGQARKLYQFFNEIQDELNASAIHPSHLKAGLILYDSDDKETRKQIVADFKKNFKIDILIVFNMLLTGFDAPRLKRLYFGRRIKDHNLLQAITRVNRPYKEMKRGFLIDFADIKKNFEETNEAYLRELNRYTTSVPVSDDSENDGMLHDNGGPGYGQQLPDMFTQVMEDKDELIRQMKEVRQVLFEYSTDNAEDFSYEISSIEDKKVLNELRKAMEVAKDAINLVKSFGDDKLKEAFSHLEIIKLPQMLNEVNHRIAIINQKEAFESSDSTKLLINEAMLNIEFNFSKIGEEEMKILDGGSELKETYNQTIREFINNFDKDDPEYITLHDAFVARFKEHGFKPGTIAEYTEENKALNDILVKLRQLKRANEALLKRYNGDAKFAYVHKRIREENAERTQNKRTPIISTFDDDIVSALIVIKNTIDQKVYDRNDILKRDDYFAQTVMQQIALGLQQFKEIKPQMDDYKFIQQRVAKQYIDQYNSYYC